MSDRVVENSAEERLMSVVRLGGIVLLLVTAGCVGVKRTPMPAAAPPAETVAIEPSATRPTEESIAKSESPDAKTSAKVPAEQPGKKPSAAPSSSRSSVG